MFRLDPDQVLRSTLLDECGAGWMRHGFGTRHAQDWPGETATLKQIHSDIVYAIPGAGCALQELAQGDALTTAARATPLSIRTADCVPVLLADPAHHAVAAIHAGWRGTQLQIVRKAVEAMAEHFGSQPADLCAAIGPAIGPCCYEVSQDVAEQFAAYLPEWSGQGKTHLDLVTFNRWQLESAGVTRVDAIDRCTRCDAEWFHSFRRDAEQSGRMHAVIEVL